MNKRKGLNMEQKRNLTGWAFLLPASILIFVFCFYPMVQALILSFQKGTGSAVQPAGFANYVRILKDATFQQCLFNTIFYFVIQVPIMLILALILAQLLNSPDIKGKGIYRTMIFLPCATSLVSYSMIFKSLFANDGLVNRVLSTVGIPTVDWFQNAWAARWVIVIALIWRWTGYNMVFYLAGLQNIDYSIYEAARIDGASPIQQFIHLTIPLLKPEEWPYNRYTWENRTNAISHYKGNQFILLTETGAEGEEDKKIYKLCIVHFSAGKVVVDQTKYFMNTGYEVLQGINYSDKYGLFIVTTKKLEYFPNGDVQTSGSRVLHIDMSRTKTMKFKDGKKYPVLIPDFAFNNELDESKFFSFEMESVAIDRNTNNMIVSVNANSPIAGDNGKHPGEDYIYRFSSIEFK